MFKITVETLNQYRIINEMVRKGEAPSDTLNYIDIPCKQLANIIELMDLYDEGCYNSTLH